MVVMIVRKEQGCRVCLLPDVSSELSVSVCSSASQVQGEVGSDKIPIGSGPSLSVPCRMVPCWSLPWC